MKFAHIYKGVSVQSPYIVLSVLRQGLSVSLILDYFGTVMNVDIILSNQFLLYIYTLIQILYTDG